MKRYEWIITCSSSSEASGDFSEFGFSYLSNEKRLKRLVQNHLEELLVDLDFQLRETNFQRICRRSKRQRISHDPDTR